MKYAEIDLASEILFIVESLELWEYVSKNLDELEEELNSCSNKDISDRIDQCQMLFNKIKKPCRKFITRDVQMQIDRIKVLNRT